MMTLMTIGLIILAIILIIGLIRIMFKPSDNLIDFFMEVMLIDYLIDMIVWVFTAIGDIFDNDVD